MLLLAGITFTKFTRQDSIQTQPTLHRTKGKLGTAAEQVTAHRNVNIFTVQVISRQLLVLVPLLAQL